MTNNILILAAGRTKTSLGDSNYPLCLTEVSGSSVIERIIDNTKNIPSANYIFAVLEDDCRRHHLDKVFTLLSPESEIVKIPDHTAGSACTALISTCHQNPDDPLMIISANELVEIDFSVVVEDFSSRGLNAGTITFRSIHPRYSYVKLDANKIVTEAAQQTPISQNATAGVFWFEKTGDFVDGAKSMIQKDSHVNGLFYIAPTFNELILKQKRVGTYPIENHRYIPLKNEKQISHFEIGYHHEA